MHDLQRRDTHLTDTHQRSSEQPDLVCLSHLRWDFVYQRPQHLLSRCARDRRVFFCEEPIWLEGADAGQPRLDVSRRDDGVYVVQPRLPGGLSLADSERMQQDLLDELFTTHEIRRHVSWYYSPMPLGFTRHLRPVATVYDCMDELSAFAGASPLLREREQELFGRADLVFTGGQSLYEAKRDQHPSVHAFPSSIDVTHFGRGRRAVPDAEGPQDQAGIGHPRLGYFGVIDERMDLELVAGVADARPDWHIVMIGPVVKIDPATLPQRPNIHWLGGKDYKALPAYIAGWDVALMPFARNESTRFISPTKTPEYLAAGKPVVSTSIRDVVRPYGTMGLVSIADSVTDFVAAGERELQRARDAAGRTRWLDEVDAFLAGNSWDSTWERMQRLIDAVIDSDHADHARPTQHTPSRAQHAAQASAL
jgi:UDP-galactopyranose mutase